MDITVLGVKIDPTAAVAGSNTAAKAATSMAKAVDKAGDTVEETNKAIGESAEKMAEKADKAAAKAAKAAERQAARAKKAAEMQDAAAKASAQVAQAAAAAQAAASAQQQAAAQAAAIAAAKAAQQQAASQLAAQMAQQKAAAALSASMGRQTAAAQQSAQAQANAANVQKAAAQLAQQQALQTAARSLAASMAQQAAARAAAAAQTAAAQQAAQAGANQVRTWDRIKAAAATVATAVGTSFGRIRGVITNAMNGIGPATISTFTRISQAAQRAFGASFTGAVANATRALSTLRSAGTALVGTFQRAGAAMSGFRLNIVSVLALVSSAYFAFKGLEAAATGIGDAMVFTGQVQQAKQGLQSLTGTAEMATAVIDKLRETSKRSGQDLAGSLDTVVKFSALGFSPGDAVQLNQSIADIAGTLGLSQQRANELGNALAQVQSKGTVSMEELRQQIAEKGVPVFDVLAKKLKVTQAALIEMVSNGEVPAKALIDIFMNLEGSFQRFAGGVDRATKTLPGALNRLAANFKDAFSISLFTPINDALVPLINRVSTAIGRMGGIANATGRLIGSALQAMLNPLVNMIENLGSYLEKLAPKAQAIVSVLQSPGGAKLAWDAIMDEVGNTLRRSFEAAGIILDALMKRAAWNFEKVMERMTDPAFWKGLADALYNAGVAFVNVVKEGISTVLATMMDSSVWMKYNPAMIALQKGLAAANNIEARIEATRTPNFVQANKSNAPTIPSMSEAWNQTAPGFNLNGFMMGVQTATFEAINKVTALAQTSPALPRGSNIDTGPMINKEAAAAAKKQAEELESAAKRIIEATRTPLEHYNQTLQELQVLQSKGLIDNETYTRAATQAADEYGKAVADAAEKSKKAMEDMQTPFQKLMTAWGDLKAQAQEVSTNIAESFASTASSAFTDFITGAKTAKEAFGEMARSIIADIIQMITRMIIMKTISMAFGGGGVTAGVMHTGGTVGGTGGASRTVSAATFSNAPKFQHGGTIGGRGEAPIIAEKGEQVLTRARSSEIQDKLSEKEKESSKGPIQVNITNVVDPAQIDQHLMQSDTILNIISRDRRKISRIINQQ